MLYVIVAAVLILFVFALSEPTEIMWIVFVICGAIFAFSLYSWSSSSQMLNIQEGYCKSIGAKKMTSIGCIGADNKLQDYPDWLKAE